MSTITRNPNKLNFNADPIFLELTTGAALDEDNLTASVVLNEIVDAAPVFQAKLVSPYDTAGKWMTNLANLIETDVPFPDESMAGTPKLHDTTFRTFTVSHSDRYGSPPTEDAVLDSDEFVVMRGASKNFYGFGKSIVSDLETWYLMHSYKIKDNKGHRTVKKVVSPDQPEVIYFFNNTDAPLTINWTATIRTISGFNDTATGSIDLPTFGLYNAYLSYAQIGSVFTNVIGYELELVSGAKTETIEYIVDDAPNDFEYILFYENGCAAMESVRFAGRHKKIVSVKGTTVKKTIWAGFNFKNGQTSKTKITGGKALEINSGYYPKEYIEHLGQMLFSDVWLYDTIHNKLIRYNVSNSSIQVDDDNELLHNLTLQIYPATETHSLNTF